MTNSDSPEIVSIPGFLLDRGRRRLTSATGDPVQLNSKAFDTLAYLAANPGRLVDKHELLDAVWPDVTVEENTLNHAISAVRRVLGDSRSEPRFIATIQGRGYQFVAPVKVEEHAVGLDPGTRGKALTGPTEHGSSWRERLGGRRTLLLGMTACIPAALLLMLTGYPGGGPSRRGRSIAFLPGRNQQRTHDRMLQFDAALSPDGRFIAYAGGPIGRTNIFVRRLDGGPATNLTRDLEGAHSWPRWSPTGEKIAFHTWLPRSHDTLHITSRSGSDTRRIAWAPALTGHAWSPDGTQIVYARSRESSGLYLRTIADHEPAQRLTEFYDPHSPSWSPDGSHIAFVSGNSPFQFGPEGFANIATSAIWVVAAADGRSQRRVASNDFLNVSPDWAKDSRSLFFISNRHGTRDIYQAELPGIDRQSPEASRLTIGLNAHSLSRSKQGDRLVYSELVSSANIYRYPIPERGLVVPREAEPMTQGDQTIENLDVSSNSEWLAYDSNLRGNQDIYKVRLTGGADRFEPVRLTDDQSNDFSPAFSPQDDQIAFHSLRNGNRDIFLMSANGNHETQLTFNSTAQDRYPDWSPDGNSIVFMTDATGSGRQEAFIVARRRDGPGWGPPNQATYFGGWYPKWSPVGGAIVYTKAISGMNSMLEVMSTGNSDILLRKDVGPELSSAYAIWSRDGRSIYLQTLGADATFSIWRVPLSDGEPEELLSLRHLLPDGPGRMEFAADDTHFYFTLAERKFDIWTLELLEARDEP